MIDTSHTVSAGQTLQFDICIVGAGAAGITLALELAESGLKIGLLEGGGLERPAMGEDHPFQGQSVGREYPLLGTRLRYFGGTTNHWGGWCRPLDEIDFERRPFVELSGWPISRASLDPYYERASAWVEIDPPHFEPGRLGDTGKPEEEFFHHYDSDFSVKHFRFSPPTRFGHRYRRDIREAESIHCLLHSTLCEVECRDGQVSRLRVRSDEKEFYVQAHVVVLALGGIENARLLLASSGPSGRELGNEGGFVGRCFADHLGRTLGQLLTSRESPYQWYDAGAMRLLPHLSLRSELLRRHRIVNFGFALQADRAVRLLPNDYLQEEPLFSGWEGSARDRLYHAVARFEPTPNRQSRVTLLNERDKYGVPRVKLDWRVNTTELEGMDRLGELFARKVGALGLGRFRRLFFDPSSPASVRLSFQSHQLGTTRMSEDARQGVVDPNSRLHHVENLYIAGSSVFPTFGFANPTLTIVALTVRLADHLKDRFANG